MLPALKRSFAMMALAVTFSSSAMGWAVALHTAADHHGGRSSGLGDAVPLEPALHGHPHEDGTPPHGHPVLVSGAATLRGQTLVLAAAMIGSLPEMAMGAAPASRLLWRSGPTHDPPACHADTVSVLRI